MKTRPSDMLTLWERFAECWPIIPHWAEAVMKFAEGCAAWRWNSMLCSTARRPMGFSFLAFCTGECSLGGTPWTMRTTNLKEARWSVRSRRFGSQMLATKRVLE